METNNPLFLSESSAPLQPFAPFQWSSIPYFFAAIAGLIYAVGFLVVFTFQHSLGIPASSLDVFKGKYVYVGLLSLQFPASILFLFLGYKRAKSKQTELEKTSATVIAECCQLLVQYKGEPNPDEETASTIAKLEARKEAASETELKVYLSWVLANVGLLFVFYLTTTFVRPHEWGDMQLPVAGVFLAITLYIIIVRRLEKPAENLASAIATVLRGSSSSARQEIQVGRIARAAVVVPEYVLIGYICWSPLKLLLACVVNGGYFYCLFVWLIFHFLRFGVHYGPIYHKHRRLGAMAAMNLSITFSFIYLSTLSYAYHIYPYVPVARGGGDYSADTRVCILTFKDEYIASIPKSILQDRKMAISEAGGTAAPTLSTQTIERRSAPLTVLDEGSSVLIVTPEYTTAERERWRLVGVVNKPQTIVSIKTDAIAAREYLQPPSSAVAVP